MKARIAVLTALGLFVAVPAEAQSGATPGADETPAAVVRALLSALATERWHVAAGYLDLERFEQYRRQRVSYAAPDEGGTTAPELTPELLMRHDPDMPRAVAEYYVESARKARQRSAEHVLEEFADVPSPDSLRRLPVQEAAARWLKAQDLRYQMRRSVAEARERGCPVPEEERPVGPAPRHEVIGMVQRTPADTLAYVLYQQRWDEEETPPESRARDSSRRAAAELPAHSPTPPEIYTFPPEVLILRRSTGRWRVLPPPNGFGPNAMATILDDCSLAAEPDGQEP